MVVVSNADFENYGCVNCGCGFCTNNGVSTLGAKELVCKECGTKFFILEKGLQVTRLAYKTGKKDENGEDIFVRYFLQHHPREGIFKHQFSKPDVRPESGIGEFFRVGTVGKSIFGFAESKEAGKRIVRMFELVKEMHPNDNNFSCQSNYKESEPLWVPIKIDYSSLDIKNALALSNTIKKNGIITVEKVIETKNIEWNFANMWKYITSFKVASCIDQSLMIGGIAECNSIPSFDSSKTKNKNILIMFEIAGMYLQINNYLCQGDVDKAVELVKHKLESLEFDIYADAYDITQNFLEKKSHQQLHNDLKELLQVHRDYLDKCPIQKHN